MRLPGEFVYMVTVAHLYQILWCWLYDLLVLFAYRYLYHFLSPSFKAYLNHEHKLVSHNRETHALLTRLRRFCTLVPRPLADGQTNISRIRAARADTPSAAFLRIVRTVHSLPTDSCLLEVSLGCEIQHFWCRGITGASKPDYFLFGGKWHIKDLPDPREILGNEPFLCAIAASTAEQMAEAFNSRIDQGIRRDLRRMKLNWPYWDKNLGPCMKETVPDWCKDVGPVKVQTVVDREGGKNAARDMLESMAFDLSPSFKKRNLVASSQFMYFS